MHAGVRACWHALHALFHQVRQYQSWSLMPFAVAIGTVYPAAYMRGARETFNPMEPNFPRCVCAALLLLVLVLVVGGAHAPLACARTKDLVACSSWRRADRSAR